MKKIALEIDHSGEHRSYFILYLYNLRTSQLSLEGWGLFFTFVSNSKLCDRFYRMKTQFPNHHCIHSANKKAPFIMAVDNV